MSFAERIHYLIAAMEAPGRQFDRTLAELTEGISRHGVVARVVPGRDPGTRWLTVAPLHRPALRRRVLRFDAQTFDAEDGNRITVSDGDSDRVLFTVKEVATQYVPFPTQPEASVGSLEGKLLDFVVSPSFRETLKLLRKEGHTPVEGTLRERSDRLGLLNIAVTVSPKDQELLGVAQAGAEVCLSVRSQSAARWGSLSAGVTYDRMESAGIFLRVLDIQADGDVLHIEATRVARSTPDEVE